VWEHVSVVMGYIVLLSLCKKFTDKSVVEDLENRSAFGKVEGKNLVAPFLKDMV